MPIRIPLCPVWFFSPYNWEVMVMRNAALNDPHWIFFAAATNAAPSRIFDLVNGTEDLLQLSGSAGASVTDTTRSPLP